MTVANTVPPAISGTARQGQTLTTDTGQWTFDQDYLTYAYQWLRCDGVGANCVDIAGATGGFYVLQAADVGSTIRSEVTATEHAGGAPGALYTADFEAGNFSEVISNQAPSRVVITSTDPLHGTKGVQVTCGPSDANQLYPGSPPRAEMEIRQISNFFGGNPEGRDTWITWYAQLQTGWDHGTANSWCLITQILGQTGTYYPAFAINMVGPAPGIMYMTVRGGTPNPVDNGRVYQIANPTPVNQLLKFKVHHHWSTGSSGTVQVYLNNVLVGSDTGPNNWAGYETTIYQKGGIYRTANGIIQDSVMLYDYVRWFTSDPGNL